MHKRDGGTLAHPNVTKPQLHVKYTRSQIRDLVGGGEPITYLPQKNGTILAGCFNRQMDPDAPVEIRVGKGPVIERKAETLEQQGTLIFPVFIKDKKRDKYYEYCGNYRFASLSNVPTIVKTAEEKPPHRRGQLAYVLRLRKAPE